MVEIRFYRSISLIVALQAAPPTAPITDPMHDLG
jgi:hypothetical protein